MRPGEPADTPGQPGPVETASAIAAKPPVFELKTKPSPIAREFHFKASSIK
jgi:hypothetical protein